MVHETPPINVTVPQTANAHPKCPVRSMIKPVSGPTTTPEMLPKEFWSPIHLPAAAGPASVCGNAKMFGPVKPKPPPITNIPAKDSLASEAAHAKTPEHHQAVSNCHKGFADDGDVSTGPNVGVGNVAGDWRHHSVNHEE